MRKLSGFIGNRTEKIKDIIGAFRLDINDYRERLLKINKENRTFFIEQLLKAQHNTQIQTFGIVFSIVLIYAACSFSFLNIKEGAAISVLLLIVYIIFARNRKRSLESLIEILIDSEMSPKDL